MIVYKKILTNSSKELVSDINSKAKLFYNTKINQLKRITKLEKGYEETLLKKTNYQILTEIKYSEVKIVTIIIKKL